MPLRCICLWIFSWSVPTVVKIPAIKKGRDRRVSRWVILESANVVVAGFSTDFRLPLIFIPTPSPAASVISPACAISFSTTARFISHSNNLGCHWIWTTVHWLWMWEHSCHQFWSCQWRQEPDTAYSWEFTELSQGAVCQRHAEFSVLEDFKVSWLSLAA